MAEIIGVGLVVLTILNCIVAVRCKKNYRVILKIIEKTYGDWCFGDFKTLDEIYEELANDL